MTLTIVAKMPHQRIARPFCCAENISEAMELLNAYAKANGKNHLTYRSNNINTEDTFAIVKRKTDGAKVSFYIFDYQAAEAFWKGADHAG